MKKGILKQSLGFFKPPYVAEQRKRRGLHYAFGEGIFAVISGGLLATHGAAAMILLEATQFELALFGTLPLVLSAVMQLGVPYLATKIPSRKAVVILSVWTQTFFVALIGLSGYASPRFGAVLLLLLFTLSSVSGGFGGGVWASWMADLVPEEIRGRYFAWRDMNLCGIQVAAGTVSGIMMQYYGGPHPGWLVFMVVFMTAAVTRFFSGGMLMLQYEPPLTYQPLQKDFGYIEFMRKIPGSNFARFTLFVALIQGTAAIASPFFNPYFLKDLHLPYLQYSLVSNAYLVGILLFLPYWGKIADRHGNWFVLKVSALGGALLPLPYLYFDSFQSLIILGFTAGVIWSAFGLSSFNYLLDAVTPARRIRCSAYMTATVGFAVFIFGLLGGWVVYYLQPLWFWHSAYQSLFILSAGLRLAVVMIFIGFGLVREIREAHPVQLGEIMWQFPGVQLSVGMVRNVFRILRRI